jgi:hypothetical protein
MYYFLITKGRHAKATRNGKAKEDASYLGGKK